MLHPANPNSELAACITAGCICWVEHESNADGNSASVLRAGRGTASSLCWNVKDELRPITSLSSLAARLNELWAEKCGISGSASTASKAPRSGSMRTWAQQFKLRGWAPLHLPPVK